MCLVAVCASAQNDQKLTGLPIPLTFTQKFILTNKVIFASSENQLQNVAIVYAYEPNKFVNIREKGLHVDSSFKIVKIHADDSEDSKRTWAVSKVEDNQINDAIKEIEKKGGLIAISKYDYDNFLNNIDMADKETSNLIKDAKQFFIFNW